MLVHMNFKSVLLALLMFLVICFSLGRSRT